jgi:hypothetical protein
VDTRLRGMIAAAKVYDENKEDYNYTMPLSTIMAMHGSVAEGAASTAVTELATALATNSTLDPTARLTQLTQVLHRTGHAFRDTSDNLASSSSSREIAIENSKVCSH